MVVWKILINCSLSIIFLAKICFSQIPFYFAVNDPFDDIIDQHQILKSSGLEDYVYLKEKEEFPR